MALPREPLPTYWPDAALASMTRAIAAWSGMHVRAHQVGRSGTARNAAPSPGRVVWLLGNDGWGFRLLCMLMGQGVALLVPFVEGIGALAPGSATALSKSGASRLCAPVRTSPGGIRADTWFLCHPGGQSGRGSSPDSPAEGDSQRAPARPPRTACGSPRPSRRWSHRCPLPIGFAKA